MVDPFCFLKINNGNHPVFPQRMMNFKIRPPLFLDNISWVISVSFFPQKIGGLRPPNGR